MGEILNNQKLGFIKRQFNTVADAQAAATAGKIVFDSKSHIIFVDGQAYGGNITDATFTSSVLTITKSVGDPVRIDFSDIASASSMMAVFDQFAERIGLDSNNGIDYSGTNYLSELGQQGKSAKNLVNADKLLDSKIKDVNDAITGMNGTAAIATESNGVVTLKAGVTQTNGKIINNSDADITLEKVATTGEAADVKFTPYAPSGLGSGDGIDATNVQDAIEEVVDEIIKNEQVTTAAFEAVQGAVGLGENLNYEAPTNTQYLEDSTSVKDALKKLDTAISAAVGGGVTDVKINGTSVKSNNEADIAVDGTYNAESNKIATKQTVTDAINGLDVTGFAQASVDTATQNQTTLSINGIKQEDGKIATDATTKTDIVIDGTYNASTNKIATESTVDNKITTRIQALDGSATIASKNGNVVTIKTGVTEEDGVINNDNGTDIVLKEVAVTGAAADVSIADADGKITATTVEGALTELAKSIEALQGAFDVVVSTDAGTTPQGVKWGSPEIEGTLVASADTFHKIYLVPAGGTTPNTYSEYITTRTGAKGSYVYGWEKLGDIAVDLTGYVKTVTVNGKVYAVDSNSTNISLGDVITAVTGETAIVGGNSDYVAVTANTTKDTTTGSNTVAITSTVKTHTVADATGSNDGLATAKNVKDYIDEKAAVVNSNPEIKVNDANAATIGTVGGTALTAKVSLYWDEWEDNSQG